jgi:transposase-like protein
LEQRRRSERALVAVVAECYVRGVSTRRVEGLVRTLGIERLSKSQVSAMAQELDPMMASFRNRPLDPAGYPYLWVDALTQRVREDGRIVNVCAVVATGVTADGKREILGVDVVSAEDGAAWTAFLRGLVARGLRGVRLVISDAHEGLKNAIAAVLDGASWQRCRRSTVPQDRSSAPPSGEAATSSCPPPGLYKPLWKCRPVELAPDLAAHLLYGTTTALSFRASRAFGS